MQCVVRLKQQRHDVSVEPKIFTGRFVAGRRLVAQAAIMSAKGIRFLRMAGILIAGRSSPEAWLAPSERAMSGSNFGSRTTFAMTLV